jgi:outer membrane immunogenic protein
VSNWLGYLTGGLAVTCLKLDATFTDTALTARSRSSGSKTMAGWSLGVGGEYALNRDGPLGGRVSLYPI